MKIAALIPLILEMNTSVDFLNLIQNVEEYNFDWICRTTLFCNVEELGLEFDLDLLVAELTARGTCRGEFATRGTQVFKSVFKKFLVKLPWNSNLSIKFHAQLEMNVIFFIIKLVTIVHF